MSDIRAIEQFRVQDIPIGHFGGRRRPLPPSLEPRLSQEKKLSRSQSPSLKFCPNSAFKIATPHMEIERFRSNVGNTSESKFFDIQMKLSERLLCASWVHCTAHHLRNNWKRHDRFHSSHCGCNGDDTSRTRSLGSSCTSWTDGGSGR